MAFPRVTILCPELGTNALGRALLLARLLPDAARPEIVGVHALPDLWPPARGAGFPVRARRVRTLGELLRARGWLREQIRGDVLLVSKALPTSLGMTWLADLRGVRVGLDVDDWEYGLSLPHDGSRPHPLWRAGSTVYGALRRRQANSVLTTRLCESLVRRVSPRLVSNRWLQRRFGGDVLYHVRDATRIDPARADASRLRASLGLDDRLWVGFVGTVRPHKGLPDLVEALARFAGPTAPGLLVLGADPGDPVVTELSERARRRLGASRVRFRPPFPGSRLPEHVALADVIAIPSRDMPHSRGQLPAKLFDAMAMARPVVATAVNDVREVLGDGGLVVPPADPDALAAALDRLADATLRRRLGRNGRARLVERYSFPVGRRVLAEFVERAVS